MNTADGTTLIETALVALKRHLGDDLAASVELPGEPREPYTLVRLRLAKGRELTVCVEARRSLRPAHLPQLQEQLKNQRERHQCDRGMVVSAYIPRPLAERLRERGIWFADAAGNGYLEIPGELLVYVTGERPPAPKLAAPPWPSAAAAKVFFGLLVHGPEVKVTYRDLTGEVGVSLGLVSRTVTSLVSQGVLLRRRRVAYIVAEPTKLLDLWCEGYERKLRPRLFRGRFRAPSESDFTPILQALAKDHMLGAVVVGGELASDLLTGHLRAGSATLFVPRGDARTVRAALRLAPSADGNIEVYDAFARELGARRSSGGPLLAHPILVYAELLATGDPRCGEAALHLKEQYLPWVQ